MIFVSSIIALFAVAFSIQPTPCESLKCYESSADRIVDCTGKCLSYLHENGNGAAIQRCCSDHCKIEDGVKVYSCSKDRCNGIHSDLKLLAMNNNLSSRRIIRKRAAEESSSLVSCYECSAHSPQCGIDETTVRKGCRACLVFRNVYDNNNVVRQCCTTGCGEPGTIGDYEGRTAYFCGSDLCNGIGAESELTSGGESSTAILSSTTVTTTVQTTSQCYDCSGSECGKEGSSVSGNCPSCMAYRNQDDSSKIERRCCWWACGAPNTVGMYNGIETYFCTGDKCNEYGVESALSLTVTTTTSLLTTAITTTATMQPTVSRCYECSGPECGKAGSSVAANCPSCMAYRNPNDRTQIERRCCWWACGPSNTVGMHDGLETYFCTGDECNGYGVESALSPLVTTTAIMTTATVPTTVTTVTSSSSAITTATTTQQTSSQCYQCSGSDCGQEGSSVAANCPSCMVYRNPNDQTTIERRCCWWNCGPSNSVKMYEGVETYFCNGDKCNGYGVESALSLPVTTTATSTMIASVTTTATSTMIVSVTTTTQMTTTTATSSAESCILNCQNGGTPETKDGCFCYCLDNTSGRECENVDCAQPDVDSEMCSSDNEPLCGESENFAFECHHLCGKC